MKTTRRGFFKLVAGAAAIAVVPAVALWRSTMRFTDTAYGLKPGDVLTVYGARSEQNNGEYVVTAVSDSIVDVDRLTR